jgi:peptidoglycan/LPS O-acetylase OafA/YrhL
MAISMSISKPAQNNIRLDYLDAVRSFALILGVFFHASLSFMPVFIGWAVMDISTSSFVSVFILINHSFRMALFFLIAGFFSHMKFHQGGVQLFLRSRLVRIVLPFIIGWFLLKPLIISAWVIGAESMRGDANILNGLIVGFVSLGELPKDLLIGTHLWFLYYLLIISVGVILFRTLISFHKPVHNALTQWGDGIVFWLCNSRIAIFVVAIPTAGCLWFMDHWGMDTPDKSLIPDIPVYLLYGAFFLFGWLLHRRTFLMERFADLTWQKWLLCIIAMVVSIELSSFEMKLAHEYYLFIRAGFMLSYAVMMWSLVSLTIGLCKRLFARPSKLVRYIADSSYWLYLIHLPIVLWLQIAFAELPLHWLIKLVSISGLTILISIVLYDAIIRSTFIGEALNGKRTSRCVFKFNNEYKGEKK